MRADAHCLLRRFLRNHPTIYLDLMEYIEATKYCDEASRHFRAFCRAFYSNSQHTNQWLVQRPAFQAATCDVPAYTTIDWTIPAYWKAIPVIDKDSLRRKPEQFLSKRLDRRLWWKRPTTGTSGPPVDVFYTPGTHFAFQLYSSVRIAWVAAAMTQEVLARQVFCLALDDNLGIPDRVWADPSGFRGLTVRLKFNERQFPPTDELRAMFMTFNPALLTLKPNVMRSIVETVGASTDLQGVGLQAVISSGAPLTENLRADAERLFGVPVFNAYGLSEFGVVASECRHRRGLHLYEQDIIAEVLCQDGTIAAFGEGELILSEQCK